MSFRRKFCIHRRTSSGASLALALAVFGFLAMAIMLFSLGFTGLLGSYHEQRSALEAATLAAAKDVSSIVINDPNFGFIGLSDASPIGRGTTAGDNFFTPVTGINTLFATIRLDMIVAHYMQDPVMAKLAMQDYNNALIAQTNLCQTINAAVAVGGQGFDYNGQPVTPYADAVQAYNANKVHLVIGQGSSLKPGSLQIKLGYVPGLHCRTPAPQPVATANLSTGQSYQGFYEPYQSLPDADSGVPFVFSAMGSDVALVDFRKFQSSMTGLPFVVPPTVVKVDADEETTGSPASTIIHATAAALCATVIDQRANPGALTFSFPGGIPPDISSPAGLINSAQIQTDPVDSFQTPLNGDYPQTALSTYSMPIFLTSPINDKDPTHPLFQHVLSTALYDWLKQGGPTVNVNNFVQAFINNFGGGVNGPQVQRYHLRPDGSVQNDVLTLNPVVNDCVSNNQFRATTGLGYSCNSVAPYDTYDLQIIDFVRTQSLANGGKHAGRPLDYNPGSLQPNPNPVVPSYATIFEDPTLKYQTFLLGPGGGAVRSTYNNEGIAVDFTIRLRPQPSS